jgi:predicted nucleic acid-binding protein
VNKLSLFWDASAVVPLLISEANSSLAGSIWKEGREIWAWNWLQVEVDAALIRRRADASIWRTWREMESRFDWSLLDQTDVSRLRSMNRGLGLRAADAGHVFVFERLCAEFPELHLVSFDQEMVAAARSLGFAVHPACIPT